MKFITCQMKFKVFAGGAAMHLFAEKQAGGSGYRATGKERRIRIQYTQNTQF
jgi:hypothetical protein